MPTPAIWFGLDVAGEARAFPNEEPPSPPPPALNWEDVLRWGCPLSGGRCARVGMTRGILVFGKLVNVLTFLSWKLSDAFAHMLLLGSNYFKNYYFFF